jgi:DNA-binding CsgD family transcriptional regulator
MGQPVQFSERERQVAEFLVLGKSNKQIALALGVSVRAVEFHLSNIYIKLGVRSRTEAALKLTETSLRESTGGELRESTVFKMHKAAENGGTSISTQRIPMKNFGYFFVGLLATTLVVLLVVFNLPAKVAEVSPATATSSPTATVSPPTATLMSAVSAKEHIVEQIRQLAAEYDQAVQAEKKNGNVEFSKDPKTGEDIFLFRGESFGKIYELYLNLINQTDQLDMLYTQVYQDETKPTPFPTQPSEDQTKTYYEFLLQQSQELCPQNQDDMAAAISVYRPDDGKYHPMPIIDDATAHCDVYGQMIEEWRTAPMLAKVNQDADMALIRQIMGQPDMKLTFQSITNLANATRQSVALYTDETGTKYYVDIETARLAEIDPNLPSPLNIPTNKTKSVDELRGIARQFASTNSPRLAGLESVLLYEENCKADICFFRWDYRNKDWSGTNWAMVSPFLQVGVLTNGQIAAYINTLDLFK